MAAHGTACLSPGSAQVCAYQTCCGTKHKEIQLPGGAELGSTLPCTQRPGPLVMVLITARDKAVLRLSSQ